VPPPGATALTVALKVTFRPKTDGLTDALRMVSVGEGVTSCAMAGDVPALALTFPLYRALTG
jgi:hypothetical protein